MMTETMAITPLFSGSSGNAILVSTGRTSILIDAGMPARTIEYAMASWGFDPSELSGILVTHEHADHIRGVGPLSRRYDIPVYANEKTWTAMWGKVGDIDDRNRCVFYDSSVFIGDMDVVSFALPHDAAAPCGYAVGCGRRRVAVATDLGYASPTVRQALRGCDMVLLEANHDLDMLEHSSYPKQLRDRIRGNKGHLSNAASAEFAVELATAGTTAIILGHMSRENNEEQLAYDTVETALAEAGGADDVALSVAHRERCAGVFRI